jgi:hypothetical protein
MWNTNSALHAITPLLNQAFIAPKVQCMAAQGSALCITHFLQGCLEAGLLGNVLPDKG